MNVRCLTPLAHRLNTSLAGSLSPDIVEIVTFGSVSMPNNMTNSALDMLTVEKWKDGRRRVKISRTVFLQRLVIFLLRRKHNTFVSQLSRRKKKKDTDMTRQGDNLRREYDQIKYQEQSCYDILYAAHKQGDRKLSENSFIGLDKRSEDFLGQLRNTMRKMLILAKGDPALLQTVTNILLEDEQLDRDHTERAKTDDFEPGGRPKQWKIKAWEGFKQTTENRIGQVSKEPGASQDDWLALHLERLRQSVIGDLQEIKQFVVPLFPDDWDVYKDSVSCYHESITKHLEEIVSKGLKEQEMTQLLAWISDYTGYALLKNPSLSIRASELLGAPLSYSTLSKLRERYLDTVKDNLRTWLPNILKKDTTDWYSESEPEKDGDKYYYTSYPVLTFKMINENIDQAIRISDDIKNQLLDASLKELHANLQEYTSAVKDYVNKWSSKPKTSSATSFKKSINIKKSTEQLKCPVHYGKHTVAILNNFYLIERSLDELKRTFSITDIDHQKQLANIKDLLKERSSECLHLYISSLQGELKPHEDRILTRQWLASEHAPIDDPVDTINQITKEYTSGLRLYYYKNCIRQIEEYVQHTYIKALMEKRFVCKGEAERKAVSGQIFQEVSKLRGTFTILSGLDTDKMRSKAHTVWDVIIKLAEIIEVEKATVKLQVTILVNQYADVQQKHVSRILRIRGDFNNSMIKKRFISESLKRPEVNSNEKLAMKETIFSTVKVK